MMLCGEPPFNGKSNNEIFDCIKKGNYKMDGEIWDKTSQEAKDFIKKLLEKDPKKRYSAD